MDLSVTIIPGLMPMDRGTIEDMLCDALAEASGTEPVPVGGGTLTREDGPSESDFQLELEAGTDVELIQRVCQQVLGDIDFALPTVLRVECDGKPLLTIGDSSTEPPAEE